MSETSESPPSPPPNVQLHSKPDLGSDIVLWRRKQLNIFILSAATAAWTAMGVYQYNLITILSWVVLAIVICLFLWGNIHRLLKKETPNLSELEIREETAVEHARSFQQLAENGIRLMLHVSAEREWFIFAGVVASLNLTAVVARHMDFVTVSYIGLVGAMTIPAIYVKNKNGIRELTENLRMKSQDLHISLRMKAQRLYALVWCKISRRK